MFDTKSYQCSLPVVMLFGTVESAQVPAVLRHTRTRTHQQGEKNMLKSSKHTRRQFIHVLALCVLAGSANLYAQTIPDGSFETPILPAGTFRPPPPIVGSPWTFVGVPNVGVSGISTNGSGFTGATVNTSNGNQVAFIQGTGEIYQLVNFPVAGNFVLTFKAIQRQEDANAVPPHPASKISVLIDGVTVLANATPISGSYTRFVTPAFSVAAGNRQVKITATNQIPGQDNTVFIDAVGFVRSAARNVDFNGDGKTDIIFRDGPSGQTLGSLLTGSGVLSSGTIDTDPLWNVMHAGDFNADGKTDLIVKNVANNQVTSVWLMNGTTVVSKQFGVDQDHAVTNVGDFNGDGKADLVFRDTVTGRTSICLMPCASYASSAVPILLDPNWFVTQTGDFNGDGKSDLAWHNSVSGQTSMWLMNGTTPSATAIIMGDWRWHVINVGDFDGDGKDDLVWSSDTYGWTAIWLMNGTSMSSGAIIYGEPNWTVTHVGDFNGDGRSDLVWRSKAEGWTSMWLMNGLTAVTTGLVNTDWTAAVAYVGDTSGDGKFDIIWYNRTTGQTSYTLMNGVTQIGSGSLNTDINRFVVAVEQPTAPIPPRTETPSIHDRYYTYYAGNDIPDFVTPNPPRSAARHINLHWVGGFGHTWCDAPGLELARNIELRDLFNARNHGVDSVVLAVDSQVYLGQNVQNPYCSEGNYAPRSDTEVRANLNKLFQLLRDHGLLNMVVALYPVDEPDKYAVDANEIIHVNPIIREVATGYLEIQKVKLAVIYGDEQNYPAKAQYDWLGFDNYGAGEGIFSAGGLYDQFKMGIVAPQRTLLVPGGSVPPYQDPEPFRVKALSDPMVIGLVPFAWFGVNSYGIGDLLNPQNFAYCVVGSQLKGVSSTPCPN